MFPFGDRALRNLFGCWTIDVAKAHDARNAVWRRRNNLDVKRSSHAREKKLRAASEDHHIMRRGDFRNHRANHFVIDLPVLFNP